MFPSPRASARYRRIFGSPGESASSSSKQLDGSTVVGQGLGEQPRVDALLGRIGNAQHPMSIAQARVGAGDDGP